MKKLLLLSVASITFALAFSACEKDEFEPDFERADHQQNAKDSLAEPAIPESALALLEEIAKQRSPESNDSSSTDFSNARIGDRASIGYVSPVPGYSNRLRITGVRIGELCPSNLVKGDREFNGGPVIYSTVKLHAYGNQLWAWVTFRARETKSNYSTVTLGVSGQWVYLRTIDCHGITQINTSTYAYVYYRGGNSGPDYWPGCGDGFVENHSPTSGLLVRKFNIIGDTGGDDISDDNNCGCDTKIFSIELNPITVTIAH